MTRKEFLSCPAPLHCQPGPGPQAGLFCWQRKRKEEELPCPCRGATLPLDPLQRIHVSQGRPTSRAASSARAHPAPGSPPLSCPPQCPHQTHSSARARLGALPWPAAQLAVREPGPGTPAQRAELGAEAGRPAGMGSSGAPRDVCH
jgi:hypothetical protein